MPTRRHALLASATLPALPVVASATSIAAPPSNWPAPAEIEKRVAEARATEIAFAAAFAARDLAGFRRFLAPDTIWMGKEPLHGPDAVMAAWNAWLTSPTPPFSWAPDLTLVLPSGDLARTSGPVHATDGGKLIGRFQSTWRRKPAGGWEIVFDFGTAA